MWGKYTWKQNTDPDTLSAKEPGQTHQKTIRSELLNYLIFGALTTLLGLAVYFGLTMTVLDPTNALELQIANVITWIIGVTFAFFTNRKYVFQSSKKNIWKEGAAFYAARVGSLLIEMLCMFVLVTLLLMNDKLAKLVVAGIVLICNYVFSKWLVFKQ